MSPVEQIKERLGIADVVGGYVKLERAGANFKAKCPFHSERTPSFFVSPSRGTYYCFGCGAKGDIFSFVEQFEGLDFRGALKLLADRAGVEITPERPEQKEKRDRLYDVIEIAAQYFVKQLAGHETANRYLKERGLTEQTIETWRLGYALPEWRGLHEHLSALGVSEAEAEEAGLIRHSSTEGAKQDRRYDVFRGRIMFPIFDSAGRPIAFSGRHFEAQEGAREEPPKYINTPETPLFNKSRTLYGFHRAKTSIRKFDFSIVVEGQMDLIMCHQAGFPNTVAPSGTALTEEQLATVGRLSQNVVLAFDADNAGVASSGRSTLRALAAGMDVKLAVLPEDEDPADLIKRDKEAWRAVVRESRHVVDFYLDQLAKSGYDERKFKLAAREQVLPYVALIKNRIDQAHFVGKIAEALGVPEDAIWEELQSVDAEAHAAAELPADTKAHDVSESETGADSALTLRRDQIARKLVSIILWQETQETQTVDTKDLRTRLANILGEDVFNAIEHEAKQHADEFIFEAEATYLGTDGAISPALASDVSELTIALEEERIKQSFTDAMAALKRAERAGEEQKAAKLLKKCQELSSALATIHEQK